MLANTRRVFFNLIFPVSPVHNIYYRVQSSVIPAKAEIHNLLIFLDSRVRGNDGLTNTIFL